MTINKKIVVACMISLIAGIGLGFLIDKQEPVKEAAPAKIEKKKSPKIKDLGDEAIIKGLRKKIKDLEKQLAATGPKPIETKEEEKKVDESSAPFGDWSRPSIANMRKFAEAFEKMNPKGYAAMTNRMARGMARRQEQNLSRLNILSSVDVSKMTEKQKTVHETYQELLARQTELENILNPQNMAVTDDDREEALKEMRELRRDMHKYANEERKILLTQTGLELGIGSENVSTFVETVEAVYDVTGGGHHRHHGMDRGPRHR